MKQEVKANIYLKDHTETGRLGDVGVDGRIILKWILVKYTVKT